MERQRKPTMAEPCHWCLLVDEGMDKVRLPRRSQLPCDLAHLLAFQYIFLQPVTQRQKKYEDLYFCNKVNSCCNYIFNK